ncbi:hypothetical protein KKH03_00320 [Patescibacteria group bacterium]|nr:hypothetical protein [Patescibacteria group bacterium]
MSTGKTNKQAHRFALLAQMNEKVFHASDLAALWEISNKNTLYTTLKRYGRSKLLYRIYKGLYSIVPPARLDPLLLGTKALHEYCYITTETVLFASGYISQKPSAITLAGSSSKKFKVTGNLYRSRKLNPKFLMNPLEILNIKADNMSGAVKVASAERAIADMLYFNSHFHFDKKVNWQKITQLQKQIGYPLTPDRYDNPAA